MNIDMKGCANCTRQYQTTNEKAALHNKVQLISNNNWLVYGGYHNVRMRKLSSMFLVSYFNAQDKVQIVQET